MPSSASEPGGSSSCDSPDSGEPAIDPQVLCGTSERFDRAFFLTDLPESKRLTTIRFVAVDAGGVTIRIWTSAYKCG